MHRRKGSVDDEVWVELLQILMIVPAALVGLVLHEVAHGAAALALGDPTARDQGRLTLNPLKHLDLMGTIFLLILHFGWAKPVQVNPRYFANPKRDMLLVALAGPATNILLAALAGILIRVLPSEGGVVLAVGRQMLLYGVVINGALAVFNMLPIPPLDGSRLVHALVPYRHELTWRQVEMWATRGLFALMLLGAVTSTPIIGRVLNPAIGFFLKVFAGVGS